MSSSRRWSWWPRLAFLALALSFAGGVPAQGIESVLSPGKLIAGHAKYEDECSQCHVRFDKAGQSRLCANCHKPVGADIAARTGYHGRLDDTTCRNCHGDHKGRDAKIASFDRDRFDHEKTDFPLRGAHRGPKAKCASCHTGKALWREAPRDCNGCHRKDDMERGHKGGLGVQCEKCHNEREWKDTQFDHDRTRFKLEDAHRKVVCNECHRDGRFKDTPRECVGCHRDTDNDKGHKGRYGPKCASCHNARSWKESTFVHDRDTKYALKGKHRETRCVSCHRQPLYTEKLSDKCVSCHRKDDQEKGHRGSLGEKCESCHNERSWKNTEFDHSRTKFPLLDRHKEARCDACHKGGIASAASGRTLEKLPLECFGCHERDDREKGHRGGYGVKCESCHDARSWKESLFRHERDARWELRGKHAQTRCAGCHTGTAPNHLYAQKLATACISCHLKDDRERGHKGTSDRKCETCHGESSWKVPGFDHQRTRFRLTGAHLKPKCVDCHASLDFREQPRRCIDCHRKDDMQRGHKGTLDERCDQCHRDVDWKVPRFDHQRTRFALIGTHARTPCEKCHRSLAYREAPSRCYGCHEREDVHKLTYGERCELCHNSRTWKSWDFDHSKTSFRLDGAHVKVECKACHRVPMAPQPTSGPRRARTCIECHQADDVHESRFGVRCNSCHDTRSWKNVGMPGGPTTGR